MNLREFGTYALNMKSLANPEPNYKYKGECVSFIQQYLYLVLNIPFKARGNAKDWATNEDVLKYFNKLSSSERLMPGDILVYDGNYGAGYGHMGLIDANEKYMDQNGIKSREVGVRDLPFPNYICILRYKGNLDVGNTFNVRVDKSEANVRRQPNTNSELVMQPGGQDCLRKGDVFAAVGTVVGENISGNSIWYKSKKGNYVWSGGLTKM